MKRFLVLLLVAAFAFNLSACGSGGGTTPTEPSKEDGSSTAGTTAPAASGLADAKDFVSWCKAVKDTYGGNEISLSFATHPATDAMQKLTAEYTEATGIKVKWDVVEETYLKNKQLLDFSGKSKTYDLLMVDGFWLAEYASKGVLAPMDDYVKDPVKTPQWFQYEDIEPAFRTGITTFENVLYGMPCAGETRFVAYRKDLFEKYGKTPPNTMDELMELAKFFYQKENDLYGISMRGSRGIHFASGWMTLMYCFGGQFLDEKTNKSLMTDQKTIDSLQYYIELLKNAPPDVSTYSHEEAKGAFLAGRAAMWVDSTALVPQLLDPSISAVSDKVDFVRMPEGPAGRYGALAGWSIAFAVNSDKKDAAYTFLIYMLNKEKAKDYISNGGTAMRASFLTDPQVVAENPKNFYFPKVAEALGDAQALVDKGIHWIPMSTKLGQGLDRIGEFGNMALTGQMTAKEACEAADKELTQILNSAASQ